MQVARGFLNEMWSAGSSGTAFYPRRETSYADRMRMRVPGNVSGLVPHVDGGSVEVIWIEDGDFDDRGGWMRGTRSSTRRCSLGSGRSTILSMGT